MAGHTLGFALRLSPFNQVRWLGEADLRRKGLSQLQMWLSLRKLAIFIGQNFVLPTDMTLTL